MATINYKNFTLNTPGRTPAWSEDEYQFHKDIIDTTVKDACSALMDTTNGHRHYRLYDSSGTIAFVQAGTADVVFNDAGSDVDVRMEGDTVTSLFHLDAANDRIGVGTSEPDNRLHAEVEDATNDGITYIAKLSHATTGTPSAGIGVGLALETEVATYGMVSFGALVSKPQDATGNLQGSVSLYAKMNGDLTEGLTVYAPDSTHINTGIGVSDPDTKLEVLYVGTQLKLSYDGTDNMTIAVDTDGDATFTLNGDAFVWASSTADTDVKFQFTGTTNTGVFTWMEDEDYFEFSDDVLIPAGEKSYYGSTDCYVAGVGEGQLEFGTANDFRFVHSTEDTDIELNFIGTTNSGKFTWMEDEDYFKFSDDVVIDSGEDIYTVADYDYADTSTIVGFDGTVTKYINIKRVGNTAFVRFYINGDGDGTTASFTVPYNIKASFGVQVLIRATDNGSAAVGTAYANAGTNVVSLYPDLASGNWTNDTTRQVLGQFFFEVA